MENLTFTKEMRKATRDVHDISDTLVNAKLAFALSNNKVWAEGLLIFYEIFRFLEEAMDRLNHSLIGDLDIEGMRRTDAFEKDLTFYLDKNWQKDYKPRKCVADYVTYLKELENNNPYMLMAYVYHLYMGLLSGGQILQKKRRLFTLLSARKETSGYEITNFGDRSISQIKRELVKAMNNVAENLDHETRQKLIAESRIVFLKNNVIIKTVEGTNSALAQYLVLYIIIVMLIWFAYNLIF